MLNFKSPVYNSCKVVRGEEGGADFIFDGIIILNAVSSLTFKVNNQFLLMNH